MSRKNKHIGFLTKDEIGSGASGALKFTSINVDRVNLGSDISDGIRSISFWFSPSISTSSMGSNIGTIICRLPNNAVQNDYMLYYNSSGLHWYKINAAGTGNTDIKNTGAMTAGNSYYITLTVDASSGNKIFINGVSVGLKTGNDTNPFKTNAGNTYLGGLHDIGIRYLDGKIWGLSFWNTSKTGAESLADSIRTFTGSETGLKAHYLFDEGSGITVKDMSENSLYNGIIETNNTGGVTYINSTIRTTI